MGTIRSPFAALNLGRDTRQVVLVADDDHESRHYIGFLMRHAGFRVIETGEGREALRQAMAERPDIVLLDVAMPMLDGYAVVRVLNKLGAAAPPFVFVSRHASAAYREQALAMGAAAFVAKPFDGKALVALVRETLAARAQSVA